MNSGNMWLQRTAILFQLGYKKNTDLKILSNYIERLLGSREFFINKAIGWILREYSKTDATWVIRYVKENENKLANLSKREALKWLANKSLEHR
jgi:3-methyladenine DNA glycosylase AlkD